MRAVFDLQAIQNPRSAERGIGRYVTELAGALHRTCPGSVWKFLLDPNREIHGAAGRTLRDQVPIARADALDPRLVGVYHVTSPFEPIPFTQLCPPRFRDARLVVTLLDLIPALWPDEYMPTPVVRRMYMTRIEVLRAADRVLAISEASARDAVSVLGLDERRVVVVGAGVSEQFSPPASREETLAALQATWPRLRACYVLYTGGADFRKNVDGLVAAYAALPADVRARHQLVLAGRLTLDSEGELVSRIDRHGVADDVLVTGYVSDEDLVRFYQAAELFVFPSLYEGFGLPVLEAIACGTPAIVGNNSSLVELIEDPNALFDAGDPRAIRETLERSLTDATLARRLGEMTIPDRHTWPRVAERTAAVYEELLSRPARSRRRRKTAAYVTPSFQQPSDDSAGAFALLGELRSRFRLDHFVDGEVAPASAAYPLAKLDSVERARAGYDSIVVWRGPRPLSPHLETLARARDAVVVAANGDACSAGHLSGELRAIRAEARKHADQVERALSPRRRLDTGRADLAVSTGSDRSETSEGTPQVGIFGTFDVENYGDLLFPRIFELELRRRLPAAEIRSFSPLGWLHPLPMDGGFMAEPLGPWTTAATQQLAQQLDLVAIGGGEIVHTHDEYYAHWYGISEPEAQRLRASGFFIEGLDASARECPVVWHSVGIPFEFEGDDIDRVRAAAERKTYIAVRDELSRSRLKQTGIETEIAVVPDSALVLERLFPRTLLERRLAYLRARGSYPFEHRPLVVQGSANLLPFVDEIADGLLRALSDHGDLPLVLLVIGPCHGDDRFADELARRLPGHPYLLTEDVTVEDVAAAIASARGYVGVSLHGAITAYAYDVPFGIANLREYSKLDAFAASAGSEATLARSARDVHEVTSRVLAGARPSVPLARLVSSVDRHFDRLAEIADTAARQRASRAGDDPVTVRRSHVALREAYEQRGRRLLDERLRLTNVLLESEAGREQGELRETLEQTRRELAMTQQALAEVYATKLLRYSAHIRRLYSLLRRPR